MINMTLAKHRGISPESIAKIEELQQHRKDIETRMKELDEFDPEQLELFHEWKENEFELQSLWRFEINPAYHQDYLLHHCKCPTMDNHMEWKSLSGVRHVSKNCVYHGNILRDKVNG